MRESCCCPEPSTTSRVTFALATAARTCPKHSQNSAPISPPILDLASPPADGPAAREERGAIERREENRPTVQNKERDGKTHPPHRKRSPLRALLFGPLSNFDFSPTPRPWPAVAGSIPCRKPAAPGSAGRERWFPSRTASNWSWSPCVSERRARRLRPFSLCTPCSAWVRS